MKIKNNFFRINILVFIAIVAFLGSCQWVTIDLPPAEAVVIPEGDTISFKDQVQPIFNNGCTGCHDAETAGNNYLVLTEGKSWASIQKNDRLDLVAPEASLLLTHPQSGTHAGGKYKGSADVPTIQKWIEQGAKNN